jgi:hypothetical protein
MQKQAAYIKADEYLRKELPVQEAKGIADAIQTRSMFATIG